MLANRELRGVDADRDTTRARGDIVAGERALTPLVELAGGGERQWVGRYDQASPQS